MVFSEYKKQRILHYYYLGYRAPTIAVLLRREQLAASRRGIQKFLDRYRKTGSITRRPGSSPPFKITSEIRAIVESQMRLDDETTAIQLHKLLEDKGYSLSKRTVLRCRTALGWTFRGSAYCQLIRDANKRKRLEWAQSCLTRKDDFDNVLWTDECSVQMESHRRFACHKLGEKPRNKPK